MSPRKLSEANKKQILDLYRNSEETTSTLADRYGVSSSTISRFLKTNLTEREYEDLIQQKRLGRTPSRGKKLEDAQLQVEELPTKYLEEETPSQIKAEALPPSPPDDRAFAPIPPEMTQAPPEEKVAFKEEARLDRVNVITLEEMLGEDLADLDEDEEDIEEIEEDWDLETEAEPTYPRVPSKKTNVKVLPFSQAAFPNTCYLVIDRASELITKPLKEFAELGKIPAEEVQQKTLPIFDNHRVARRFSHRSQRVIKVPDCRLLKKTCSYLKAKGITRLLIDGQVYSLSPLEP